MKKAFFLFLVTFTVFTPFSTEAQEEVKQVVRLRDGRSIDLADSLTRRCIEALNAYDLRVLRNAYFAKYWYRFQSDDLLYSFIPYPWYLPAYTDVSENITKRDKENIRKIQEAEQRLKKATEMNKDNPLASKIIGVWHEMPMMPAGFADAYQFFEDGVFVKNFNQMDCAKHVLAYIGSWKIDKNDSIQLTVNTKREIVGGEYIPSTGSCGSNKELVGGKIVERPIPRSRNSYLLSFEDYSLFDEILKLKIVLEKPYFKYSDNPKDYY